MINEYKKVDFSCYYLYIVEEAYNNMEIKLGPFCDESHEIIVKSLIKEYNPTAKIISSDLRGKIRKK